MEKEIKLTAYINNKGQLKMYEQDNKQLKMFAAKYPGQKAILSMVVYDPQTKLGLIAYYKTVIVDAWIKANYDSGNVVFELKAESQLNNISPFTNKKEKTYEIHELTREQIIFHIEYIKQYLAENFSYVVK